MKNLYVLSAFVALAFVPATSLAIDDIQMLPSRIKLDSTKNTKSHVNIESKDIAYSVKVTNTSFKDVENVTVKYNIFYQVMEIGSKDKPDIKLSAGSHTFPSLPSNKPADFETDPIKLGKASLDAGWYYTNGAAGRAQDKVVGVWLKAFDSTGKQIGEYANPSSVGQTQKWKD